MSDHMTDQQASDLRALIALLAARKDWVKADVACRLLGLLTRSGAPNIRYLAQLRKEARGKIISTRKPPYGYKLMRYATQMEYDHHTAMIRATINEMQDSLQESISEWNHWDRHKKESKGQMALL